MAAAKFKFPASKLLVNMCGVSQKVNLYSVNFDICSEPTLLFDQTRSGTPALKYGHTHPWVFGLATVRRLS